GERAGGDDRRGRGRASRGAARRPRRGGPGRHRGPRGERAAGLIERLFARAVIVLARLVTGVRGSWQGCRPDLRPRVYFANHASHGDFILIWTVMPRALR